MTLRSPQFKNNLRLQSAAQNMPPLTLGEIGTAIQVVQETLVFLNYPLPKSTKKDGSLDGVFGSETKLAIQAFQRKNSLKDDGSVGRFTLAALDSYCIDGPVSPIPRPPAKLKHEVRLHLRFTVDAGSCGLHQVQQATKVFAAYQIRLKVLSRKQLVLKPAEKELLKIVETTISSKLSEEQKFLLRLGPSIPPTDIVAYFVYRLNTPDIGFISGVNSSIDNHHAVIVASNASGPNVLAHEITHVLLGKSYWPFHSTDPNNLMFQKAPSLELPILTEEQLFEIRRSPLLTKLI